MPCDGDKHVDPPQTVVLKPSQRQTAGTGRLGKQDGWQHTTPFHAELIREISHHSLILLYIESVLSVLTNQRYC